MPVLARNFAAGLPAHTLDLLIDLHVKNGDAAAAFVVAERAQARSLVDRLAGVWERTEADARATPSAERRQRLTIAAIELAIDREQSLGSPVSANLRTQGLSRQLAAARRAWAQQRLERASAAPAAARGDAVAQIDLDAARALAGDQLATLIVFHSLPSSLVGWRIEAERAQMVVLDVGRHQLEGRVSYFSKLLATGEPGARVEAADLHRLILAPLLPEKAPQHLVIVPHGPLHDLPFEALFDDRSGRYMIETTSISYAPSATALRILATGRTPSDGGLLAVGNSDGTLPAAEAEARAIADLYGVEPLVASRATEFRVREALFGKRIVHLGVHGVIDRLEDPMFFHLELASGAEAPGEAASDETRDDGRLEAWEILEQLDLSAAQLVVLSACHTGDGEIGRGDQIASLARAFLAAGSEAVVSARWAIDDRATSPVMVRFHQHVRAGLDGPEALRRAQCAALDTPGQAHPFYWAAFSYLGDRFALGSHDPELTP